MVEEGPKVTWKEYDNWRASLPGEQIIMGGYTVTGLKEHHKSSLI